MELEPFLDVTKKKNAASALWSTLKNDFPFVYLRETEGLNESHYSSL